ncbi:Peptidase M10 metallopeptidase domain-containing protein [Occultella aeris]|uniref:Peptidase M10 metallopeptidase domain-containing protein n=2 Tax=Occultella aeris TaxID=2761496 RepID=A0A7M4DJM5_9MICO|nr:hypothetical protein HALOF300_02332 [Occultella aeris]
MEAIGELEAIHSEVSTSPDGVLSVEGDGPDVLRLAVNSAFVDSSLEDSHVSAQTDTREPDYSRCLENSATVNANWFIGYVEYELNTTENLPPGLSPAAWEALALESAETWSNGHNSCGLNYTQFDLNLFRLLNTTSNSNINADTSCGTNDGRSIVDFGPLDGTWLGWTCTWTNWVPGRPSYTIVDADVRIDSTRSNWTTSPNSSGCSGDYDIQALMTHEFGHFIGFGHVSEWGGADLTMSPELTPCDGSARLLGLGDLAVLSETY